MEVRVPALRPPAFRLRPQLRRAAHAIAAASGLSRLQAQRTRQARILMYHAVLSQGLFAAQVRFLQMHFELIGLRELAVRLSRRELRGTEVAITFDDGVRNHHTSAYPVLRQLGAPATFFVCPGLIDDGRWIWNMELRARLQTLAPHELANLARGPDGPTPDIEGIVQWAKRLAPEQRAAVEQRVRALTSGFRPSPQQLDLYSPLSWSEVQSLDPAVITIGSHTSTHPILTTLTAAQAEREITGSRRALESRLGREVDCFCYPNGSHADETVRLVSRSYDCAVTTEAQFTCNDSSRHRLPRIPAGETWGLFQWRLHRPGA
jgi:peptidoglycan/xylan/chitin deacetylase (PgdA/CDA1 family)